MTTLQTIPIDKGIPLPAVAHGQRRQFTYQWAQMDIGDSFLFPPRTGYTSAYGNARDMGMRLGRKFALRTTPEGLRCWRIA